MRTVVRSMHWTRAYIDQLPDSAFAYIAAAGKKDATGRTKPRSLRHFPLRDKNGKLDYEHVRDALSRAPQSPFGDRAMAKIRAAAKALKIGQYATHAAALAGDGTAPKWIELLPLGEFRGRDGRGPFKLDDPAKVIAATRALDMDAGIPIDFDHATDYGAPRGNPAPAAGWIKELAVGDGFLCGRVEWTRPGAEAVAAKRWRYVSPVFEHSDDGKVIRLLRAGLTNNPNLKLPAIAASQITTAEKSMAISANAKKSKVQALVESIKDTAEEVGLPVDTLLEGISHQLGGDLADPDHDDEQDDDGDDDGPGGTLDGGDDEDGEIAARHREEAARRAVAGTVETPAERHAREAKEADELGAARKRKKARAAKRKSRREVRAASKKRREARHAMTATINDPDVAAMARRLRDIEAERLQEKAAVAVNEAIRQHKLAPAQRAWGLRLYLESPSSFGEFVATATALLPR
ncbi:MAG: phage protease, partial [Candidatus Binataceae bacterium]